MKNGRPRHRPSNAHVNFPDTCRCYRHLISNDEDLIYLTILPHHMSPHSITNHAQTSAGGSCRRIGSERRHCSVFLYPHGLAEWQGHTTHPPVCTGTPANGRATLLELSFPASSGEPRRTECHHNSPFPLSSPLSRSSSATLSTGYARKRFRFR